MLKARVASDPTSEESSANSARVSALVADSESLRLGSSCTPSHVPGSPTRDARSGCMHTATNVE